MIVSSLFLILVGLALEALSLWGWRHNGGSHIPLVPPILIAIGAWQFPDAPLGVRIALTIAGIVLHVAVPVVCARGIVPKGERPR